MSHRLLSRRALARVLRSLLLAELRSVRGRKAAAVAGPSLAVDWPDHLPLGAGGLDCDSLEVLSLAAAANEMFHLHEVRIERALLGGERFGEWLDAIEAAWDGGVAHVTFTTSGSTGRPKRCTHPVSRLGTETAALGTRWRGRERVVALAPAHHIYGFLFTALLPDHLGLPCVAAADRGSSDIGTDLRSGDLVVSFPERWAYLARSLPAWAGSVEGVVSTAPCPPELLADLVDRGLSRMTEMYGSSETAGIAWRVDPGDSYELMPHWSFADSDDQALPSLAHDDGTVHALMDRIVRTGPRTFQLDGRRDSMVQVGGVNVSPSAVAERLRHRPGVRYALVRLMRSEEGRRLKAFVVPEPGVDGPSLCEQLSRWAADHLSTAERPASFAHGQDLPTDIPSKAFDW